MNSNLETRVKGRGGRFIRNTMLVGAIVYGTFKIGQVNEANNNNIQDKRILKNVREAVIEEGYTWKNGSDHKFYQFEPVLMKDAQEKVMWGEFAKDSIYTGRVREDGKVGNTLNERAKEYNSQTWEDIKENSNNSWNKTRNWFKEKIDYIRRDKTQEQ